MLFCRATNDLDKPQGHVWTREMFFISQRVTILITDTAACGKLENTASLGATQAAYLAHLDQADRSWRSQKATSASRRRESDDSAMTSRLRLRPLWVYWAIAAVNCTYTSTTDPGEWISQLNFLSITNLKTTEFWFFFPPLQSMWSVLSVDFLSGPSLSFFLRSRNSTCKKGEWVYTSCGHLKAHFLVTGSSDPLYWDFCTTCDHPQCAPWQPSLTVQQWCHPHVIQSRACNRL